MTQTPRKSVAWLVLTAIVVQLCIGVGLDRVAWCFGCPVGAGLSSSDGAANPALLEVGPDGVCCTDARRGTDTRFRLSRTFRGENCACLNVDLEFASVHLTTPAPKGLDGADDFSPAGAPAAFAAWHDRFESAASEYAPRPPNAPALAPSMTPVERRTTLLI